LDLYSIYFFPFLHGDFSSPEFNSFDETLTSAINTTIPPTELGICRVASMIHSRIDELSNKLSQVSRAVTMVQSTGSSNQKQVTDRLDRLEEKLDQIISLHQRSGLAYPTQEGGPERGVVRPREEMAVLAERPRKVRYLSRDVQTVCSLWIEWTEGLGDNPSIEWLNKEHGATWRSDVAGTFIQINSNIYL
jgi:tetrahydromethanopterin S-methyltransferase subunit G